MDKNKLIVFEDKRIRRTWFENEWHFSIIDIIDALDASSMPKRYWSDLKNKLRNEEGFEVYDIIVRLKLKATDGKLRETDCASTKNIFRIIQSIPSKKAEPFKQWLAQLGQERIQEIENPELAQERMKKLYEQKGYSQSWIDKRLRGIAVRQELTDEWDKRDVGSSKEYAILTAEISKATFGMIPKEYKEFKGLKKENLRDHRNDLELIFNMLGEKVTSEITKKEDKQGFNECKDAATIGGKVAEKSRLETEKELSSSVVSSNNYLEESESEKKKLK